MLTVGFVPGRADVDPEFFGEDKGLELSLCSVGETIANAKGEFRTGFHELLGCVIWKFFDRVKDC